jgi:membrane-anchored protein YejM (alkaline phosphatase superfamily)
MFTFKSLMFLMFVNTVAFCFFVTYAWEQGGLLYIVGTIASTVGITLLMCAEGEIE